MHTIGSMMMIAEMCPASAQCRAQLARRRDEQRKQSLWLYRIVEIGGATNFVVDQFLKTRAGENVLAVLSAIIPVMSKTSCNATILSLFEKAGAPMDHTPGLGQLENVRDTVVPLATQMRIKDKVLQYHAWMTKLHTKAPFVNKAKAGSSPLGDAYDSIPSEDNIANIVLQLHKLSKDDSGGLVMVYYGLAGAPWVAAYARDVLGLPVCVFSEGTSTVPISGDYKSAKVILRTYSIEQRCELQRVGKVEDFIQVSPLASTQGTGWTIDAGSTNYFDLHVTKDDNDIKHVFATLAESMTLSCIDVLAITFCSDRSNDALHQVGLIKFNVYYLPVLRKKALSIMRTLGFDCGSTPTEHAWKRYLCYHYEDHFHQIATSSRSLRNAQLKSALREMTPHLAPRRAWLELFGVSLIEPCKVYTLAPELPSLDESSDFNDRGKEAMHCLIKAVNFACVLAFTDWGIRFRAMSVRYLHMAWDFTEPHPLLGLDLIHCMLTDKAHTKYTTRELIDYSLRLVTDDSVGTEISDFADPLGCFMATTINGVVIVRSMAVENAMNFSQPVFLSFYPGSITFEGEKLFFIKSSPESLAATAELVLVPEDKIAPSNEVKNLELVSRTTVQRNVLLIQTEIMLGAEHCQNVDPILISEVIPTLMITERCSHSYFDAYHLPKQEAYSKWTSPAVISERRQRPQWQGGLSFQADKRPFPDNTTKASNMVFVQNVDNNPIGQWIACQWTSAMHSNVMILQKDACLNCVFQRVMGSFFDICIINGRIKDQPSPKQISNTSGRNPNHTMATDVRLERNDLKLPETNLPEEPAENLSTTNLPVLTADPGHGYNPQRELNPGIAIIEPVGKKDHTVNPFANIRQKWRSKSLDSRPL